MLYHSDGLTLQSIGDMYNVSRERVRQIMKRFGIATIQNRERVRDRRYKYKTGPRFKSLDEYLRYNAEHSKHFSSRTAKKYLPAIVECSSCHRRTPTAPAHVHHLVYPARQTSDIRVRCPSCHKMTHGKGLTYVKQIDIHNQFLEGKSAKQLAQEYHVSEGTIYNAICKIASASRSTREGRHRVGVKDIRSILSGQSSSPKFCQGGV